MSPRNQVTSVQSILAAGAFATVPPQIGARCITRDVPATLLCFPSCVPYVSVRRGLTSDVRRTHVAAYYPIFDSARFQADSVQLSYGWSTSARSAFTFCARRVVRVGTFLSAADDDC
jgi:hypothetical protein